MCYINTKNHVTFFARKFSLILQTIRFTEALPKDRSSRLRMFFKIGVLKTSQILQENTCVGHLWEVLFLQNISDGFFFKEFTKVEKILLCLDKQKEVQIDLYKKCTNG